ncbi:MAG: hypothetical protein PHS97_00325 [Oscillospiraceae bacterium]|nr:hypothetical protein [Oscillospiraceae bacterium]
MEDLEGRIGEILANPESMEQIMSIAKSLGFPPPDSSRSDDSPHADGAVPVEPLFEENAIHTVMEAMKSGGKISGNQMALLNALRPFLNQHRQQSISRAIRIAKLASIAEAALRNYGAGEK